MSLQDELEKAKSTLLLCGFNSDNGQLNYRAIIVTLLALVVTANQICYINYEWDNIDHRVNGFKSLAQCMVCFLNLVILMFDLKNLSLTLNVIKIGHYQFPYPLSVNREKLLRSTNKRMMNVCQFWYTALTLCPIIGAVIPIIYIAIKLLKSGLQNIDINELPILYPVYYPNGYETFPVYCLAYTVENMFIIVASRYGYVVIMATFVSMQTVESDLDLLCLSLLEMDETITSQLIRENKSKKEIIKSGNKDLSKSFLKYIVKHHQSIYRKVSDSQKGTEKIVFILNAMTSIYACAAIYYVGKKHMDALSLIQQMFFCMLMSFHMFCHDFFGERIQTADENLRKSLYACPWTDKPEWFKMYLKIAMTRASRHIEIKPIGLFQLNLQHFTIWMNTAYSYFNILNNFQ